VIQRPGSDDDDDSDDSDGDEARAAEAWRLRGRGRSPQSIAEMLGMTEQAVDQLLARKREEWLAKLASTAASLKADQTRLLNWCVDQLLGAWDRSTRPRKRAASKKAMPGEGEPGDGDEIQTTEVVERDGDPAYMYAAMHGMAQVRVCWGLDVQAAQADPSITLTDLARDMWARGQAYERERRAEAGPGDTLPDGDGQHAGSGVD
jgi:hypothetical protein